MIIDRLKEKLYERVSAYWAGAVVAWGSTDKVKPNVPLVVLRLGTVTRAEQPVTQLISGIVFSAYPSETTLQVDLFTRGKLTEQQYFENTAAGDMIDFVSFMDSTSSVEWSSRNDISVALRNGVQDLSEVINDIQWKYRSMCELSVSFTQWAAEYHGILGEDSIVFDEDGIPAGVERSSWRQTSSGGGSQELAEETTGFFEDVSLKRREEEITNV
jgi:hypothetical protein